MSAIDKDEESAYRAVGVDIDAQDEALAKVKDLVKSTEVPGVLSELGSFGGLFRPELSGFQEPVLVSSADGVGTKLMVARMAEDYSTVGRDLVNHCVNDILVQGAVPLFFLDYVGAGVLEPQAATDLVRGVAAGCRENGCALLGGETAEMPGFYSPGDYELVGFVVGLVDRPKLIDGSRIEPGDAILGLPSSGLHTNGYSLARHTFFEKLGLGLEDPLPSGASVKQTLLEVHRTYLPLLRSHLSNPALHGVAHITGGGLTDNIPRILPAGCSAVINLERLPSREVFEVIGETGVSEEEMLRVFNMGIGMVLVVGREESARLAAVLRAQGENVVQLGEIVEGSGTVNYRRSAGSV
ncbi:MAG: phosphoribosylformylglycinamidine cyclo-ligase [Acidobacteriota bacterium]